MNERTTEGQNTDHAEERNT